MRIENRIAIALTALLVLSASAASARDEIIRWRQDAPTGVNGYELSWGTSSGGYGTIVDLHLPTPDTNGVYSTTVSVPDGATIYMALQAYDGSGRRSPLSNEIVRFDGGSTAPPPPPPASQLGAPGTPYLVYPSF